MTIAKVKGDLSGVKSPLVDHYGRRPRSIVSWRSFLRVNRVTLVTGPALAERLHQAFGLLDVNTLHLLTSRNTRLTSLVKVAFCKLVEINQIRATWPSRMKATRTEPSLARLQRSSKQGRPATGWRRANLTFVSPVACSRSKIAPMRSLARA